MPGKNGKMDKKKGYSKTGKMVAKKKDKKLALSIQRQLRKDLSLKSNGIKRSRFYVLRHTKMPAVLLEPLFMSNPKEKKLLSSSSFRHSLATSIFHGIKNYYRR